MLDNLKKKDKISSENTIFKIFKKNMDFNILLDLI